MIIELQMYLLMCLGAIFGIWIGWALSKEYYEKREIIERIKTLEQRSRVLERIVEGKE